MIKEVMQYLGNWTKLLFKVIGAAIFAAGGVFMIGERLEIGRLEAEAVCRVCPDPAGCMQVRGYLSSAPHYPDLTRRMIGSYTRTVGSLLGANYSASDTPGSGVKPATAPKAAGAPVSPAAPLVPEAQPAAGKVASNV
ncbi:MAG: hypothetical protein EBZ03_02955 [Betaproteobacteria bacterium]|nr:hypothetical protein [Betaproteobacteria bacterium]NCV39623.1 hypothetical protein [Betaproteobacteria bacterium]NCV58948.1 hypothetical protein [Betaproteobacteria bacterium]NCV69655.1 hypothetical protein [Betaproteobacteria bacterium]NCX62270.1 hypothetical protein [Betaproteobacteria bacterium]